MEGEQIVLPRSRGTEPGAIRELDVRETSLKMMVVFIQNGLLRIIVEYLSLEGSRG